MDSFLHLIIWGALFGLGMDFIYFRKEKSKRKLNQERKKLTATEKAFAMMLASLYFLGYIGCIVRVFFTQSLSDINMECFIRLFVVPLATVSLIAEIFNFFMNYFKKKNMFKIMEYTTECTSRCIFLLRIFPIIFLVIGSIIILSN